jgi:hypothetical protein
MVFVAYILNAYTQSSDFIISQLIKFVVNLVIKQKYIFYDIV